MVAGSSPVRTAIIGEMTERSIALVLKTKDLHGSVGSNPSLTANMEI